MNSLINVIKDRFSLLKIAITWILSIIITFLVTNVLSTTTFLTNTTIDAEYFIHSTTVIFLILFSTYIIGKIEFSDIFNNNASYIKYRSCGISRHSLFWGKTLYLFLVAVTHLVFIALTAYFTAGIKVPFANYSLFIGIILVTILIAILFVALVELLVNANIFIQLCIDFSLLSIIIISLFLVSLPTSDSVINLFLSYLPFAVIFDLGYRLLQSIDFSLFHFLYIFILFFILIVINTFLYIRKLTQ